MPDPHGRGGAGVRQDTDLIVAPDTAAQSAQVSGGVDSILLDNVRQDIDLPPRQSHISPAAGDGGI
ncbi:hypothetical protein EEL41_01765 [Muribaculaceae bacterium Isolate-084 (Janvier)]|nr:hypothetical protein EEL37_01765 [Muribaculaceae bacterium Isolate-077 (Janvier)]ROT02257.1 hypothetical protein EEL41_01765 [Muribaculaceae bacterium Isolate-084 (Janvier)]